MKDIKSEITMGLTEDGNSIVIDFEDVRVSKFYLTKEEAVDFSYALQSLIMKLKGCDQ